MGVRYGAIREWQEWGGKFQKFPSSSQKVASGSPGFLLHSMLLLLSPMPCEIKSTKYRMFGRFRCRIRIRGRSNQGHGMVFWVKLVVVFARKRRLKHFSVADYSVAACLTFSAFLSHCYLFCVAMVPDAPRNLQAVALSPTSVSVSWDGPVNTNGPIVTFKVRMTPSITSVTF